MFVWIYLKARILLKTLVLVSIAAGGMWDQMLLQHVLNVVFAVRRLEGFWILLMDFFRNRSLTFLMVFLVRVVLERPVFS